MRVELFIDGDREVFLSAVSIFHDNAEHFAGAFKVGEPPAMIAGEFVKESDGKIKMFGMEKYAMDAAKELYFQRKKDQGVK